jgi:carbonyl reductase 1
MNIIYLICLCLLVRNLALSYPSSPLQSGPLLIYLTARSAERGQEAVNGLRNDLQLKKASVLVADGGETTIAFRSLDISDGNSIYEFKDFLKKEHPEGVDILVNNAGVFKDGLGKISLRVKEIFGEHY